LAGASMMKKWMLRSTIALITDGATSAAPSTVMRSSAKSVRRTRVSAAASSIPT
jgi:hypothetical protein